jgi:hypothetical protein
LIFLQGPALAGDVVRSKVAYIGGPHVSCGDVVGSIPNPFAGGTLACSLASGAKLAKVEPQVAKLPKVPARRVPRPYRANPKSSPREGSTLDDVGQLAALDADGWKVMGVLLLGGLVVFGLVWLFQAKKKRRQRAAAGQPT